MTQATPRTDAEIQELVEQVKEFHAVDSQYDIDHLVLAISQLHKRIAGERPEWLRSKSKSTDIPRWNSEVNGYSFEKEFHYKGQAQAAIWIVETLDGQWAFRDNRLHFERSEDALAYKVCHPSIA